MCSSDLQTTAIFLFVFVVQLLIQGVHEMSEQGYMPFAEAIHEATEAWGPDSAFGHFLTYMLVVLPLGWLLVQSIFAKGPVLRTPPQPRSLSKQPLPTTRPAIEGDLTRIMGQELLTRFVLPFELLAVLLRSEEHHV